MNVFQTVRASLLHSINAFLWELQYYYYSINNTKINKINFLIKDFMDVLKTSLARYVHAICPNTSNTITIHNLFFISITLIRTFKLRFLKK